MGEWKQKGKIPSTDEEVAKLMGKSVPRVNPFNGNKEEEEEVLFFQPQNLGKVFICLKKRPIFVFVIFGCRVAGTNQPMQLAKSKLSRTPRSCNFEMMWIS